MLIKLEAGIGVVGGILVKPAAGVGVVGGMVVKPEAGVGIVGGMVVKPAGDGEVAGGVLVNLANPSHLIPQSHQTRSYYILQNGLKLCVNYLNIVRIT